jgi:HD superfamily phosphohydrolase
MLTYHRGQSLHPNSTLIVVDGPTGEATPEATQARPLGSGATGVVVRAIEQNLMPRAVKILAPRADLNEKLGLEALLETFLAERMKLALLTHSHLAKLVNYGTIPATPPGRPHALPYLVMDFVEGMPLHTYLTDELIAHQPDAVDIVVNLLADVLGALAYMHRRNAMHADVKEANILVRQTADRPEAILVDMGCAHIFETPREYTVFYSTKGRHEKEWDERIGQLVEVSTLAENRVHIDLHMFAVMLALFMNRNPPGTKQYKWQEHTAKQLERALGTNGIVVLERVAQKCSKREYNDAADAANDLRRLLSGYVSPLGVAELSIGSDARTSVALPDTRVVLTQRLAKIANHPCLQRLRDVTQLDVLRLVYPGASHTRLLHSYETYEIARLYVGTLLGNPYFRAYAAEKSGVEAVLLQALLHDIGHYPLEHIFEDFAYKKESQSPYGDVMTDDQIAAEIFLGTDGPVADTVRTFLENAATALRQDVQTLPDLIATEFGKPTLHRLQELVEIQDTADAGLRILASILDGPLDADKVAYLRTDALMTGARFGNALDMDSLLGSLTCLVTDKIATIAITEKGISAAEAIATGRRWMYQRVYWHRTNRALMAMMRYPIQYTFENATLTFHEYLATVFGMSDVEAIKFVHARFVQAAGDRDVENPALMIVEGRRGIYKRFLEFTSYGDAKTQKIHDYLFHRTCKEWRTVATEIATVINEHTPTKASDILLDVPVRDRPQLSDIYVIDPRTPGKYDSLSAISEAYGSTKEFFIKASMLPRLFIHPGVLRELAKDGKVGVARAAATDHLLARAEGRDPSKGGKRLRMVKSE